MSLDHRGGNGQPMMDREEHTHLGENENQTGAKKIIDVGTYAMKVVTVDSVTYLALAAPGASQSDSVWQCRKIDSSSGTVITWADGNSRFDNVSSDLAALTYE